MTAPNNPHERSYQLQILLAAIFTVLILICSIVVTAYSLLSGDYGITPVPVLFGISSGALLGQAINRKWGKKRR